ncbi:MAG TPA: DUF1573 domain-containing protein [Planctomycetota bacterium]|nr:DUF1573 domain-containing protein [Planctomycetota bacterium]
MRALLLFLFLAALPAADLLFDQETLTITPKAGDDRAIVAFPFRNAGTQVLTISKLEASCGCTTVDLEKLTYQPKEKGEITVIFDLDGLSGLQEKSIQVFYDRGAMILLHLKALMAEAPTIAPTFLTWKVGAAATEQVAVITMPKGVIEHVTEITSSSPAITGKIFPHDDDTYALAVTPTSTTEATNVMLTVRTDLGRTLRVFASVAP